MTESIRGYDRASFLDLALLAAGTLESAFEMCALNDVSLTDEVEIGREYTVLGLKGTEAETLTRIENEHIRPATEITASQLQACAYDGIGFMGIEIDFRVF